MGKQQYPVTKDYFGNRFLPTVANFDEWQRLRHVLDDGTRRVPFAYQEYAPRQFDEIKLSNDFKSAIRSGAQSEVEAARDAAALDRQLAQIDSRTSFFANAGAGLSQALTGVDLQSDELAQIRAFAQRQREAAQASTSTAVSAARALPARAELEVAGRAEELRLDEAARRREFANDELDRAAQSQAARIEAERGAAMMGRQIAVQDQGFYKDDRDLAVREEANRIDDFDAKTRRIEANTRRDSAGLPTEADKRRAAAAIGLFHEVAALLPTLGQGATTATVGNWWRRQVKRVNGEEVPSTDERAIAMVKAENIADQIRILAGQMRGDLVDGGIQDPAYYEAADQLRIAASNLSRNPQPEEVVRMVRELQQSSSFWKEILPPMKLDGNGRILSGQEALDAFESMSQEQVSVVDSAPEAVYDPATTTPAEIDYQTMVSMDPSQVREMALSGRPVTLIDFDKSTKTVSPRDLVKTHDAMRAESEELYGQDLNTMRWNFNLVPSRAMVPGLSPNAKTVLDDADLESKPVILVEERNGVYVVDISVPMKDGTSYRPAPRGYATEQDAMDAKERIENAWTRTADNTYGRRNP